MRSFLLAVVFLLGYAGTSIACTLWGSIGSVNQNRDVTLIAKNRDWKPDQSQVINMVKPAKGYPYLGVFATGDDLPGLKAGVNRKGLVVISASASSIPKKERKKAAGKKGLMRRMLSTCASVEDVLKDQEIFSQASPVFLMIADQKTILCVEIGLNGRYALMWQGNGTICHTNHYLSPSLLSDNIKIGESSRKRYEKIKDWLAAPHSGFSLEDFIRISEDQSNGPRNSILRKGACPGDERTLATWIVAIPRNGFPTVYIKLRNPGESEKTFRYTLDDAFWKQTTLLQ